MDTQQNGATNQLNGVIMGILIGICITLLFVTEKGRRIIRLITDEGVNRFDELEKLLEELEKGAFESTPETHTTVTEVQAQPHEEESLVTVAEITITEPTVSSFESSLEEETVEKDIPLPLTEQEPVSSPVQDPEPLVNPSHTRHHVHVPVETAQSEKQDEKDEKKEESIEEPEKASVVVHHAHEETKVPEPALSEEPQAHTGGRTFGRRFFRKR